MKKIWYLSLIVLTVVMGLTQTISSTSFAQEGRNVSQYNLANGIGLQGFDPVAVFPEGGSAVKKGLNEFSVIHAGVTYLFASQNNLDLFNVNPEKYEPTYGGWCAYAMGRGKGSKVPVKVSLYTINGNRAHYFVARSAKASFDRDIKGFEENADKNWKRFSGESPRL